MFDLPTIRTKSCNHSFQDFVNYLCTFSLEREDTSYFSLHCHLYTSSSVNSLNKAKKVLTNFDSLSETNKLNHPLYGDLPLSDIKKNVLSTTTVYVSQIERFSFSLCHSFLR